jgi:hypothetical protein
MTEPDLLRLLTDPELIHQIIQILSSVKFTHNQQSEIDKVVSTLSYFQRLLEEREEEQEMSKLPTMEISKFTDEELLEEVKVRMKRNIMPTG